MLLLSDLVAIALLHIIIIGGINWRLLILLLEAVVNFLRHCFWMSIEAIANVDEALGDIVLEERTPTKDEIKV